MTLVTFGPEQVKEESSSEDNGNSNSHEDIVRRDSDKVVIVHCGIGV